MTRERFGRRRNDRRTGRRRADCWLLRRFTTAPCEPKRRGLAALGCRLFATGCSSSTPMGPDGLIDRKAPGQPPRLNDAHRSALAAILESGPVPAIHGRAMADRRSLPVDSRGIPRCRVQADVEPRIARLGLSQALGGRRSRRHRALVRRRGAHRPEEQDHSPLGQARTRPSAPKDQRTASAYIFGAICPKDGKGAALVMP